MVDLMTETTYCIHEGSDPCIIVGPRAWVYWNNAWKEVHYTEISYNSAVVSKERFDREFGELPPLPPPKPRK
jgi:hypothetical protein